MSGIKLAPGSKVFTARCKNLYILTTKHKITAKNKIDKIKIENPFERIITVIDNNDYSYKEMDTEEELEIVKERLSTSSTPNTNTLNMMTRASSSRMSSSKRKYEISQDLKEMTKYHYFITGIMDKRKYKILINTGQEENHITRELVLEEEIMKTGHICPGLPSEIINTNEETTEKEIIIGGIPLKIQFKIYEGNYNITLGIKWLEKVKPYSIENEQLTITCQNKKIIIKRTKND